MEVLYSPGRHGTGLEGSVNLSCLLSTAEPAAKMGKLKGKISIPISFVQSFLQGYKGLDPIIFIVFIHHQTSMAPCDIYVKHWLLKTLQYTLISLKCLFVPINAPVSPHQHYNQDPIAKFSSHYCFYQQLDYEMSYKTQRTCELNVVTWNI